MRSLGKISCAAACCGMLRHAAACFYLHMWVPTLLWEIELTNKRQHAQHCWAELTTFTIRIVCSGFVDIHHSQMAQSVVAHMQTVLVWMWPIKLNVRSTWQAERGRRTKKTAMLLNVGKSSFLAPLRFSWFWLWDVDNDRGVWLWWCLHTNGWGL